MKKIFLDTNFLMIPSLFKIDIFTEIDKLINDAYELLVLDKTIDELNLIVAKQKGKDKQAAKLALTLLDKKHVKISKTDKDEYVDDLLINLADKDTIVATQDTELKKRLHEKGSRIIILRQKKYLKII